MVSYSSVHDSDKPEPYIPQAGVATDGWSKEDEAIATCFCGTVQLGFINIYIEFLAFPLSPSSIPWLPSKHTHASQPRLLPVSSTPLSATALTAAD
jgi:hypothetical protein